MAEKRPVKREVSAGGAVFKKENGKVLWLLIQPKRDKKPVHWRLPKGIIEENETTPEAALREVEEETGVRAEVIEKIGQTRNFYTLKGERIFKIIIFFLMKFMNETGNGPDVIEAEKTDWLNFKEALERLTFKSEKEILQKAKRLLEEKENQPSLL